MRQLKFRINIFTRRATDFHRWAKLIEMSTPLKLKDNFPLDGQTRQAKSSIQLVNLLGA